MRLRIVEEVMIAITLVPHVWEQGNVNSVVVQECMNMVKTADVVYVVEQGDVKHVIDNE